VGEEEGGGQTPVYTSDGSELDLIRRLARKYVSAPGGVSQV